MRELVIVVPDLYLSEAPLARPGALALPALDRLARLGDLAPLDGGWRRWVARWAGLDALAHAAPAAVVAAALGPRAQEDATAWLATPLHLVPGLTSLLLDPRGLLDLEADDVALLVEDFARAFAGSGFALRAAAPRALVLLGPPLEDVRTHDPARWLGTGILPALPQGRGGLLLQRLGSEIEMWLHGHELNARRARRGALAVNSLWAWGGEPASSVPAAQRTGDLPEAHGDDPWLHAAWTLAGRRVTTIDPQPDAVLGSRAGRAVVVKPAFRARDARAPFAPALALEAFDAEWVRPAAAALGSGRLGRLTLVAGDRALAVRRAHGLRFWRRGRSWLGALQ